MPKARKPAKSSTAKSKPAKKPARKPVKKVAKAKPAKPTKAAIPAAARLPEATAPVPEADTEAAGFSVPAASRLPEAAAPAEKPATRKPHKPAPMRHPGKPEQPLWTKSNRGHTQKMMKGRSFRHQGR